MDKFTLLELHVHDGMRFSAKNTAPAIGRSEDADDEYDEYDEYDEEVEYEADDDLEYEAGTSGGKAKFFLALLLVVGIALAARKLMGGDDDLEIAELDDLTGHDEADEQEAEV